MQLSPIWPKRINACSKIIKNTDVLLDQDTVDPSNLINWLGIYFVPSPTHASIKFSKANSNLHRMARIVNISRGLSPAAIRQL